MTIYKTFLCRSSLIVVILINGITNTSYAQIEVNNAEHYSPGMNLTYKNIHIMPADTGYSGPNQVWDFSNLSSTGDSTSIRFVSPKSMGYDNQYGPLSFIEISSDSTYVYARSSDSVSHLLAFQSIHDQLEMTYPSNQTFMVRPLSYNAQHQSEFKVKYTANGYQFSGAGNTRIAVDGYGTLLLPEGKSQQVLRVRLSQTQYDTLEVSNTIYMSQSVSYLWFDGIHPEPLLRINKYTSSSGTFYSGGYIVKNTLSSNQDLTISSCKIFPNPARNQLTIYGKFNNFAHCNIYNIYGNMVLSLPIEQTLNISKLPPGPYFIVLSDASGIAQYKSKFVKF